MGRRVFLSVLLFLILCLTIGLISTLPVKPAYMKSRINFELLSLSGQLLKEVKYAVPSVETEKSLEVLDEGEYMLGLSQ